MPPQPSLADVKGEIDAEQRRGEAEPSERVLQMFVAEGDLRLSALGPAAGIGRGVGFHQHGRRELHLTRGGHRGHVARIPDAMRGVGLRREEAWRVGDAPNADHHALADLSARALGRIDQLGRHDAAIHHQHAPVARLERRQHMIDRPAAGAAGVEVGFLGVEEPAVEHDAAVLRGAAHRQSLVERDRRLREALVHLRDQAELPMQALHLPDAERDQRREHNRADDGEDGERAEVGHGASLHETAPHPPRLRRVVGTLSLPTPTRGR